MAKKHLHCLVALLLVPCLALSEVEGLAAAQINPLAIPCTVSLLFVQQALGAPAEEVLQSLEPENNVFIRQKEIALSRSVVEEAARKVLIFDRFKKIWNWVPVLAIAGESGKKNLPLKRGEEKLGQFFARKRISQDWSQQTLAVEAGIAIRTISRLESENIIPSRQTLANICRALNIMPEQVRIEFIDPMRNERAAIKQHTVVFSEGVQRILGNQQVHGRKIVTVKAPASTLRAVLTSAEIPQEKWHRFIYHVGDRLVFGDKDPDFDHQVGKKVEIFNLAGGSGKNKKSAEQLRSEAEGQWEGVSWYEARIREFPLDPHWQHLRDQVRHTAASLSLEAEQAQQDENTPSRPDDPSKKAPPGSVPNFFRYVRKYPRQNLREIGEGIARTFNRNRPLSPYTMIADENELRLRLSPNPKHPLITRVRGDEQKDAFSARYEVNPDFHLTNARLEAIQNVLDEYYSFAIKKDDKGKLLLEYAREKAPHKIALILRRALAKMLNQPADLIGTASGGSGVNAVAPKENSAEDILKFLTNPDFELLDLFNVGIKGSNYGGTHIKNLWEVIRTNRGEPFTSLDELLSALIKNAQQSTHGVGGATVISHGVKGSFDVLVSRLRRAGPLNVIPRSDKSAALQLLKTRFESVDSEISPLDTLGKMLRKPYVHWVLATMPLPLAYLSDLFLHGIKAEDFLHIWKILNSKDSSQSATEETKGIAGESGETKIDEEQNPAVSKLREEASAAIRLAAEWNGLALRYHQYTALANHIARYANSMRHLADELETAATTLTSASPTRPASSRRNFTEQAA